MSTFAGVSGYETLSSALQQQRSVVRQALARNPSFPPAHLSRTLYIPRHESVEFGISVVDVSAEYEHAIGHSPVSGGDVIGPAPMGGMLFMTRLNAMAKPAADDGEANACYAVHAAADADRNGLLTVQESPAGFGDAGATIVLQSAAPGFSISTQQDLDVVASFPQVEYPFFTFSPSSRSDKRLQWRIDPLRDGPLRYTLVETDTPSDKNVCKPETIRAIYHNMGSGPSLSMGSSEGVLLLPQESSDGSPATELVILASLLGLLWRVRGLQHQEGSVVGAPPREVKKTLMQRILGKKVRDGSVC